MSETKTKNANRGTPISLFSSTRRVGGDFLGFWRSGIQGGIASTALVALRNTKKKSFRVRTVHHSQSPPLLSAL